MGRARPELFDSVGMWNFQNLINDYTYQVMTDQRERDLALAGRERRQDERVRLVEDQRQREQQRRVARHPQGRGARSR